MRPRPTAVVIAALTAGLLAVGAAPPATAGDPEPSPAPGGLGSSHWPCGDWGMYGRVPARTFDADCPSSISRFTASSLAPLWAFKTGKTVSATPAVVDGQLFVGDWTGAMYALDADTGAELWRTATIPAPGAPFGPIVSSAVVADVQVDGEVRRLVIFGAGPRMYALDASDGSVVWVEYFGANQVDPETTEPVGEPAYPEEQTEFESSPVVWDGVVYAGMDVHNRTVDQTGGVRGGLWALDATTGEPLRFFNPELDNEASGCSSVWSSPTLDVRTGLVYVATGNCPHDDYPWTPHIEAVTALDLGTFEPRWTFQPEPGNRDDTDFGATPNLFLDRAGQLVLGIGKKNAVYYALDPATGELLWETQVADPGNVRQDFAVGGFIGSTATGEGHVYGGTAIGGPPYYHALDGRSGQILWQGASGPTYAASAHVNGVTIAGALDDVVRAWDAQTGQELWAAPALGPVSAGPVVVGDRVYVASGTSSSDACAKDAPASELCLTLFDEAVGATGGVQAFELQAPRQTAAAGGTEGGGILLGGEGDRLRAWDLATLEHQVVVHAAPDVPGDDSASAEPGQREGMNINAQICPFPDGSGRFVAGEDTGQGEQGTQGWGIFRLHGDRVGDLEAELLAKLAPTFVTSSSNPENYGCGFLSGGRIVTTDVGDQFPGQPATGQLIVWFPPFDSFDVRYCKIDVAIPTAGGIHVDDQDRVYVASNRGEDDPSDGAVLRYAGDWPTSDIPAGGCGRTDPTGAPLVDEGRVEREVFIEAGPEAVTPSAIVDSGRDTFYVSSVFSGTIAEYDRDGAFLRFVLTPPGPPANTTGTPFGLALGPDGSLYYADLGIVGAQPAPGAGTVRRIRFTQEGQPLPPEVLRAGLAFPDGLGIVLPPAAANPPAEPPTAPPGRDRAPLPATGGGAAVLAIALGLGGAALRGSRSSRRPPRATPRPGTGRPVTWSIAGMSRPVRRLVTRVGRPVTRLRVRTVRPVTRSRTRSTTPSPSRSSPTPSPSPSTGSATGSSRTGLCDDTACTTST